MYYYFFRGLLAALTLQALQNKCGASGGGGGGGGAAGFHGKYDPIFKYYLCGAHVIIRTLQDDFVFCFFTADETAQKI